MMKDTNCRFRNSERCTMNSKKPKTTAENFNNNYSIKNALELVISEFSQSRLRICLILAVATGIVQGQTLRSLADAGGIHFGAAVTFPASPAVYDTTLVREFNGLV